MSSVQLALFVIYFNKKFNSQRGKIIIRKASEFTVEESGSYAVHHVMTLQIYLCDSFL